MTYVIAEIGNNHNGSLKKCISMIDAAKSIGANAVKIQSFRGRDIVTPNILSSEFITFSKIDKSDETLSKSLASFAN